ncbi:MAG: leucyl/phenylalanyl-tRNA--protein transferase [Halieaceae bacterium]|jgi:leucyl/phenylalanyl-tRNA---protein transferase|nr:leucyl/phenylalanyl-tRNA--protein transferase [Halieaceae bacterium]
MPVSDFPPSSEALDYPNGLLAVGGELTSRRLIAAYRRGIFPWYEAPQPVMWWTPDPRSVLFPESLHISRSLRKTLRRDQFGLSVDRHFNAVMGYCGSSRRDGPGTWISNAMLGAYTQLHELGIAHSVEIYSRDQVLVGGLYGVALGQVFFGESMFSTASDASKVALVALVGILQRRGCKLIDCQVESDHMNSMGARNIARLDFEALLAQTVDVETSTDIWTVPATCGELL